MGLEKAIKYSKEKRKPYRDSRSFDYSCRNHGDCPWCERNRQRLKIRDEEKAKSDLQELASR